MNIIAVVEPINYGKRITTESIWDGAVSSVKTEFEVSKFSSKEELLKDVIEAVKVISTGETRKLNIEILLDSQNRLRIVRRWLV